MSKSALGALCLALLAGGCGSSDRPMTVEEGQESVLTQVGELCRLYQQTRGKPPEKPADLASVRSMAAGGYAALKSGRVVLRYGAALPSTDEEPGEGPADEVLAYFAEVPQGGGKVLMLNRTGKTMTADEFKAAKKAGKEGPAPAPARKARSPVKSRQG
jgi:hypothetical protein